MLTNLLIFQIILKINYQLQRLPISLIMLELKLNNLDRLLPQIIQLRSKTVELRLRTYCLCLGWTGDFRIREQRQENAKLVMQKSKLTLHAKKVCRCRLANGNIHKKVVDLNTTTGAETSNSHARRIRAVAERNRQMKFTVFTTKTEHHVCTVTPFTVTPLFRGSGVRHAGGGNVQDAWQRVTGSKKIICLFGLFIEMSSRVRLNTYRPRH